MSARRTPILLLALALPLGLAACGGDSGSGSSSASSGGTSSSGSGGGGYKPPAAYGSGGGSTTASGGGGGSAGTKLNISADASGQLAFDTSTLKAKAGTVTITMANPSSSGVPHAVAIEGNGVDEDGETAGPGGTSTVTAKLKPGTYTFYCPVDGHEQAGMKGTLTVS